MGKQRVQYRESTEGSAKWAAGHNAGCAIYAPDHECICAEIQAEADEEAVQEAANQKADSRVVGYGCLLFIALALGIVTWAVCAYYQHREDEAVAAYSICEMCGTLLDETNAHAVCVGDTGAVAVATTYFGDCGEVAHADLR